MIDVPANERRTAMPLIEVKLYDRRVTEESVPKMIAALTDALAETSGAAKENIQVVIQGVPPQHWGIAGKPGG
jgi:4-oxalocrotonate tautomerase